jgi:hypothetical protein
VRPQGGGRGCHGWPTTGTLLPYYRRWGATGVVAALEEDPGVGVGDAVAGADREADVVVSLCRMGTADVEGREHHRLWLVDHEDPGANPNLDFLLSDAARAIIGWREAGRRVLLPCGRAESRAPAVAAAYLAERFGLGGPVALERVGAVLPGIRPNPAFQAALARLWPAG